MIFKKFLILKTMKILSRKKLKINLAIKLIILLFKKRNLKKLVIVQKKKTQKQILEIQLKELRLKMLQIINMKKN